MQISRQYTREGQDPFAGIKFTPRTSRIVNPNGTVVFEMKDLLAPEGWSQVAVDILAQKYFRRGGHPLQSWSVCRRRACPTGCNAASLPRAIRATGHETDCPAGLPPSGRLLDLLGMERRLLLLRG